MAKSLNEWARWRNSIQISRNDMTIVNLVDEVIVRATETPFKRQIVCIQYEKEQGGNRRYERVAGFTFASYDDEDRCY